MGNCIDNCKVNEGGSEAEEKNNNAQCESRPYSANEQGMDNGNEHILKENVKKKSNNKNNGKRVKMVLTKDELQWLMLQLRNRENVGNDDENKYKRIEDVLLEIEKGRKRLLAQSWRPSLDSISELNGF